MLVCFEGRSDRYQLLLTRSRRQPCHAARTAGAVEVSAFSIATATLHFICARPPPASFSSGVPEPFAARSASRHLLLHLGVRPLQPNSAAPYSATMKLGSNAEKSESHALIGRVHVRPGQQGSAFVQHQLKRRPCQLRPVTPSTAQQNLERGNQHGSHGTEVREEGNRATQRSDRCELPCRQSGQFEGTGECRTQQRLSERCIP